MPHPLFDNILVGNGYTDVEGREITYIDYYRPVPQELVADYAEMYNINTDCHNACLGCQIGQLEKYPSRTTWKIKNSQSFLYRDKALTKKTLPLKKHQHVDIIERKGELFNVSVSRYIATCMRHPKEHKKLASMSQRSFTERKCDECESEFTVITKHAKGWVKKSDLTGFMIQCDFIPKEYRLPPDYDDVLTDEQKKFAIASMDPSMWAQKFLARTLRPHQEVSNRCSAKYKVLRWGRRSGKTYGMAMNMLNFLFNVQFPDGTDAQGDKKYRGGSVLILSPFLSQIELIFDNLIELLQRNDDLFAMKSRHVKTPYHRLEIDLGGGKTAVVKGFTTGAQSKQEASTVRGQSSDLIYADEVDYIPTNDLRKAIEPILLTYPHVKMWSSSTPSGKREWFYKECKESPHTKEFYFPSTVLDNWDDIKNTIDMTHDAFMQEYMGDFIAQMMGVYQPQYVGNAEVNYGYGESNFLWNGKPLDLSRPMPRWVYSIGVDWNSNAGTEIVVTGMDEVGRVFVVDAINIPKQNWMMIKAEQRIFELHKHWNPQFIYVDAGYGVGQIEHMQAASRHAKVTHPNSPDAHIEDKLVSYDFSKKIEFRDPNTGTMKKALAKPFLVENSIRQFENGLIFFPFTDKTLHNQLLNYIKENVSITGIPRYGQNDKKIGDHRVDALNLALVAYKLERTSFAMNAPAANNIAKLQGFGSNHNTRTVKQGDRILTEVRQNVPLQPDGNPAVGYSGLAVRYDPEYLKMVEAEKVLERSGEVRSRSRAIEKKPRESVTGKVTTLRPGIENDTEWKFKLQQRFSRAGARVMKRSSSKPTRRKV